MDDEIREVVHPYCPYCATGLAYDDYYPEVWVWWCQECDFNIPGKSR